MRVLISILVALLGLSGCERPPIDAVQHGYRGTGMAQIYNQSSQTLYICMICTFGNNCRARPME